MNNSEAGKLGAIASAIVSKDKKSKRIKNYDINPKLCKFCNSKIPYSKRNSKFCNHTCSAKFNNLGVSRNKSSKIKNRCTTCNRICKAKMCIYCSVSNELLNWINNYISLITGNGKIPSIARNWLKNKYKECQLCGWNKINQKTKKVPLEIDHIDGNYKNNKKSNLRVICPNCHSLTPTFRNLNKGNGRENRRKCSLSIKSDAIDL